MSEPRVYEFRDPESLVKWTRWSVYAQAAVAFAAILAGYLEHDVFVALRDGAFHSREEALEAAGVSDARQQIVSIVHVVVTVASGILILRWVHRANWNAHSMGAPLRFTPGWAVGWFFVPVMNIWRPYQVVKEIWEASFRAIAMQGSTAPGIVGLWWFLWLVYCTLGNVSFRVAMNAKDVPGLISANVLDLAANLSIVPLCMTFLAMMARVQEMQAAGAAPRQVI
jgi:hypothetical protein